MVPKAGIEPASPLDIVGSRAQSISCHPDRFFWGRAVGGLKGVTIDSEGLKRQFYEAMGFDVVTGQIKKEAIEKLGLRDILHE